MLYQALQMLWSVLVMVAFGPLDPLMPEASKNLKAPNKQPLFPKPLTTTDQPTTAFPLPSRRQLPQLLYYPQSIHCLFSFTPSPDPLAQLLTKGTPYSIQQLNHVPIAHVYMTQPFDPSRSAR